MTDRPLTIIFATPAYWPAVRYGGPVRKTRELAAALSTRGHELRVYTSGLTDLSALPPLRTRTDTVDGIPVRRLATPLRVRWVGFTPTMGRWLERDLADRRPDVLHVFGFRDSVGLMAARWARHHGVPYVFEPLGMYAPRLHKLRTKRLFDTTLARHLARGAQRVIATSALERDELVDAGIARERIAVRPNGFPKPEPAGSTRADVRTDLGLPETAAVVVYVGRLSAGKGLELLADAAPRLGGAHLVVMGPDSHDGTSARLRQAASRSEGKLQLLPVDRVEPRDLYEAADLLVLPSASESFGNVAAEASAAGLPSVVTNRCGIAELVRNRSALVVPYDIHAITTAIRRLLEDGALRGRLAIQGPRLAEELSWDAVAEAQDAIYRAAREHAEAGGTLA